MTPNEQAGKQLSEYGDLQKKQEQERRLLFNQQRQEMVRLGHSPQLASKHEQEAKNLEAIQKQHLASLQQQHNQQHEQLLQDRALAKPMQDQTIVEQRNIEQQQRREESENYGKNWEAYQKEDKKSIMDRLRKSLEKNKDHDRDL